MRLKAVLVFVAAIVGMSGCASYEYNAELADGTGKYDGVLEIEYSADHQMKQLGYLVLTCWERTVTGALLVHEGRIYFQDKKEPVGIVTADGDIQVHSLAYKGQGASYELDEPRDKDSYLVIRGKLDAKNRVSGKVIMTYGNSTTGCEYEMTGRLVQEKLLVQDGALALR